MQYMSKSSFSQILSDIHVNYRYIQGRPRRGHGHGHQATKSTLRAPGGIFFTQVRSYIRKFQILFQDKRVALSVGDFVYSKTIRTEPHEPHEPQAHSPHATPLSYTQYTPVPRRTPVPTVDAIQFPKTLALCSR